MTMKICSSVTLLLIMSVSPVLAGDFDTIQKSYGDLTLIAGLGQLEGTNGWQSAMEGTNALAAELSAPHMTQADSEGNLYIADKESHSVLKITLDGTIHTVVGTHLPGNGGDALQPGTNVAMSEPNGLYVLPNGTVYVLDKDNAKIRKLNTNGNVITVVPDTLPIAIGRGMWVSSDESTIFYTSKTNVMKWTSTGGVSTYSTGYVSLGNVDMGPRDGNLVVTDQNAHRVYRVFTNGTREVIAGDGFTSKQGDGGPATNASLDGVRGIAFLPNGGYFLATKNDGDIWYVDTNNIAHEYILGSGSNQQLPWDGLAQPRGISIAPWGDLIITENSYGDIRIVPRKLVLYDAGTVATDNFEITWSTMPSVTSTVDVCEDLILTNWQTLAILPGDPADILTRFIDTNAWSRQRSFYRIRMTR